MKNSALIIIAIILLAALGVGGYFIFAGKRANAPEVTPPAAVDEMSQAESQAPGSAASSNGTSESEPDTTSENAQTEPRGESFSAFSLASVTGGTVTNDDLKGQVTHLRFSTSTCHICAQENADYWGSAANDPTLGGQIIDINIAEPLSIVQSYISQYGFTHDFLLDEDGAISVAESVFSTPKHVTLYEDGSVCQESTGYLPEAELRSIIQQCAEV